MKRLTCLMFVFCLVLGLAGCGGGHGRGLHIVEVAERLGTRDTQTKGRGTVMRERYIYPYPEAHSTPLLAAEDDGGNLLETGVDWVLEDPTLGTLSDDPGRPAMKWFAPTRSGETIVTASNAEATDTARLVVYPAVLPPRPRGFNLSTRTWVAVEADADIWFPSGTTMFRFEAGYYTKHDDPLHPATLESLDELTVAWGEIGPPGDYTYYNFADQLFLVKSREGAVYAAMVSTGFFCYKPTPVFVPAP